MSSKAAIFKFLNSFNELNFPFKFRSREALYESDVSFTEILDLSKFKPAADPDEMLTFNSLFLNSISALIFCNSGNSFEISNEVSLILPRNSIFTISSL